MNEGRFTEAVRTAEWLGQLLQDEKTAAFFNAYGGPLAREAVARAAAAAGVVRGAGVALDETDISVLVHGLESRSTSSGAPAPAADSALEVLLEDEATAAFFETYGGILTEAQVARTAELAGVHLEEYDVPVLVRGLEALHTVRARLQRPS
jgi:hypothetical protein